MTDETVEFQWDVHEGGHRWIETDTAFRDTKPGTFLTDGRPVGAYGFPVRRYAPLALYSGLFQTFADTEPTPEAVKAFADKFGLLGGKAGEFIELPDQRTEKGFLGGTGERLSAWHQEILIMRQAVDLWDQARQGDIESLRRVIRWTDEGVHYLSGPGEGEDEGLRLRPDSTYALIAAQQYRSELLERFRPDDLIGPALYYIQKVVNDRLKKRVSPQLLWERDRSRLGLCVVPGSLLDALWLQFARAIERNNDYRKCVECGTWFELSPRTARSDKVYCSNACRTKAYRKRRAGAARRASPVSQSAGREKR